MQQATPWRSATTLLGAAVLAVSLSACVVVPLPHARAQGVVVVEPARGPGPHYHDRYERRYDRYDRRNDRNDRYGR